MCFHSVQAGGNRRSNSRLWPVYTGWVAFFGADYLDYTCYQFNGIDANLLRI